MEAFENCSGAVLFTSWSVVVPQSHAPVTGISPRCSQTLWTKTFWNHGSKLFCSTSCFRPVLCYNRKLRKKKTIRLSYYIQLRRRWTESVDVLGDKNRAYSCQKRGGGQDLGVPSFKKRNKVSDFLWQSSLYNSASQVANSCYTWKISQLPALRLLIYFLQR